MIFDYIHRIFWFIGLILLQVLILNNMHIGGYATPFLYLYFILKIDSGKSRNEVMLWAFFMGLIIDIFSNTPGMNTAATVFLAFIRPTLLRLFTPRDSFDNFIPSFKTMGAGSFFKYMLSAILIQNVILLTIESFSFSNPLSLILRIVSCTLLTITCISAIEGIRK